jgi:hypothetical protein
MLKEYSNRWNKPLVNKSITLGEYETIKHNPLISLGVMHCYRCGWLISYMNQKLCDTCFLQTKGKHKS